MKKFDYMFANVGGLCCYILSYHLYDDFAETAKQKGYKLDFYCPNYAEFSKDGHILRLIFIK